MIQSKISVILCAYRPRPEFMRATLHSLEQQNLPLDQWELIIIDNNSPEPLAGLYDVSWHPNARFVVEPLQGLAHARRRGYMESVSKLVIHSDDDNILAPDYLSCALEISRTHPLIGTFGGQLEPRFEIEPKNNRERGFGNAVTLEHDVWSNILDDNRTMPFGAGMCLRRAVGDAYLAAVLADSRRLTIGRTGDRLITGEDIDLNYTAIKAGYGTGRFKDLKLVHFVPVQHMTEDHIVNYDAGNAYSMVILWFLHTGEINQPQRSIIQSVMFWSRVWIRLSPTERRREIAMHHARSDAARDMKKWGWIS